MKKKIIIILAVIIFIIAMAPWLLYGIGLYNVSGRPEYASTKITNEEAKIIWKELRETGPIHVEQISPWEYALLFFKKKPLNNYPGMNSAWFVVRDFNLNRIENKRIGFWHLSGASMTIWLTRNWTTNEILSKVKEIKDGNSTY